jgi:type I restriction enzyme S subunit
VSEVPHSWTTVRLDDLGEVRLGKMLDKAKNRGLPTQYLRNINVRWFRFDLTDLQMVLISEDERELLSVQDDDLFICEGGEPCRCAVWRNGTNSLVYQKALHRFRTSGGIVPELLMYRLCHDADSGALQDAFTGTTIKHLTRESLSRYEIPLPPINEQRRIADKLDAVLARVDACRERLDRVPAILKRFRQAVLAAATSGKLTEEWREDQVSDDWQTVSVEAVAFEVFDGPFGSNLKSKDYSETGVRVVRLENIGWVNFIADKETFIPQEKYEALRKHTLRAKDVLFSSFIAEEVRVCLLPHELSEQAINKADCFCVRTDPSICLPELLALRLACRSTFLALDQEVHGATRPRINLRQLKEFTFDLPPLSEQREIVRRVEALFAYADRLEARYTTARTQVEGLAPALLAKAFRGELVSQDPNDEPASMLLERIRAARAASQCPAGPEQRRGGGRSKTSQKADVLMLTRKDVQDTHLITLLSASSASSRRSSS